MRYPASQTAEKHEKIVMEASRLFRRHGLNRVTVADLMAAAELTHGSFYNHFESKTSLVGECIERLQTTSEERIAGSTPTDAGKKAFAARYLSLQARDEPDYACLLSSLSPEIAREPSARPALTRYVQSFIDNLAKHFSWPRKANARRDSIRMLSSMVGAMVLARAVDDEVLSAEILRTAIAHVSSKEVRPATKPGKS